MTNMKNSNGSFLPLQRCLAGEEVRSLSDQDVIALSLGLLKKYEGLAGLAGTGIREIAQNHGIGLTKAVRIHSAFEMGRRVITKPGDARYINNPAAVWELLLPVMACL